MLVPFSMKAKVWEPAAVKLRQLACMNDGDLLDPWKLAPRVGLQVSDGHFAVKALAPHEQDLILRKMGRRWSGGVLPKALPDGTKICILNPTHSRRRHKITLMEEIAHIHLKHTPTTVTLMRNGLKVRDYNRPQEEEAYGVGAAALIPWQSFFSALNGGKTIDDLSEEYDVTRELISYRIKITGGYRLYHARQRR